MAGAPSVFPAACLRALTRAGLGFVFSLVVFAATLWVTALAVSAHGPEEGLISAPDVCGPGGFVIPVRTAGPPLCTAGPTSPPDFPSPPALRLQAATAMPKVTCVGDGRSGPRAEILYVYEGSSRLGHELGHITEAACWRSHR